MTLAIGVAPLLAAQTSQTQLFSQVQEYSGKRIALSAQDANTVSIREAVAADPAATPLPDAPSAVREKQSTEEPAPPPKPAQELTSKPGERSGEVTFTVPFWAANGLLAATTIVNAEMIARCRPDACQSVPAATVQHFLPGDVKVESALPVDGTAESACNWTVDQAPVYRLLQLNLLAYAPNGLASGNGSATFAAIDAYESALAGMQNPPEHSADPRATVTTLGGLGNEAFSARQVFRRGGAVTDVATVVVRYHNVVVTATMNGLQHSNRGSYGPVSLSQLASAALAFAQAAEATLH